MRYGALLDFLMRRLVLPRLAGGEPPHGLPLVDTWRELFAVLLAGRDCLVSEAAGGPSCCDAFVEILSGEDPRPDTSVVRAGCEALVTTGATFPERLLLDLDPPPGEPGAAEAFRIGTPPGAPCRALDQDGDPRVDALGTPGEPCTWTATLRLEAPEPLEASLEANFVGQRE